MARTTPRTTKTRTKSSPNGKDMAKRMQQVENENTRLDAEKVSWRPWVKAHAASMVFVLSVMGGGFAFLYAELRILDAKIEAVETNLMAEIDVVKEDIAEVKENQARTEAKVDNLQKAVDNLQKGVDEMRRTFTEFLLRADQDQNADPEDRNVNLNGEGNDAPLATPNNPTHQEI